jgi:ATP-dependent RNA helicase RhlE
MYTQNRNRSGGRQFNRGHRPRFGGQVKRSGFKDRAFNDVSKFVNKVEVTEEALVFKPEHAFSDFLIEEKLKKNIEKKGYVNPTPIQDKSIPHVLQGQDVVGIANTGTGKTAAFLIPIINKILGSITDKQEKPAEKALVIVPTRELAIQIQDEFRGFTTGLGLYSVCVVGGTSISPQISSLKKTHDIVIGTPGRLKDLIDRKVLNLGKFNTVVLDEADRMLDMGFINEVKAMIALLPKPHQTLFFSATMSNEIKALISQFLVEPVTISVKTGDTSKNVDQDIVRVTAGENKIDKLFQILKEQDFNKVLIFGKTKHGVEKLSKSLLANGFTAESIHGNKNHSKRQQALGKFKDNKVAILVATDVAARGLDISDVSHVINYDLPATYEDYIHRIGRTGRAGKVGKALTFIERS